MSLAFLYPGQGSQRPDMLRALPASPAVTRTLDEAALELDHTRWPAGLDDLDTAEALQSTTNVQLALLISGVAAARALTDDRGLVPAFVAGHSVGAFAAAVTAGVLTFAEAMSAVRLRGDLMQQICSSGQWGMAAVLGLRSAAVGALADRVSTPDEPVWIANINAADQIVLSGSIAALERAKAASRLAGARRWEPLDVTVASHCPLQKPTAERMAAHLAGLPRRPQRVAYLTNTGGRRVRADSGAVLDDLAQAVARPVQWYDAMRLMPELGATCAIQMPTRKCRGSTAGRLRTLHVRPCPGGRRDRARRRCGRGDLGAPTPALAQSRSPISPRLNDWHRKRLGPCSFRPTPGSSTWCAAECWTSARHPSRLQAR